MTQTSRFIEMAKVAAKVPGLRHIYGALRLYYYMFPKTGSGPLVYQTPPGHFYSPIPDRKDVLARAQVLFDRDTDECPGIDLRKEAQFQLLDSFSHYYNDLPFSATSRETTRYYYPNLLFSLADAIPLYSVLRHFQPHSVIEIGSGFSSAAMLDINDLFLQKQVHFTFVEPYPERLLKLLTREDKNTHAILDLKVQEVPLEVFHTLSANDILFVDSSHVVKTGSDVAYILFDILPELRPGVIIHFHDIFWPFQYPERWILEEGWMWNEAYFLRSFLQYNTTFKIIYFNSFIEERHPGILREKMPLCLESPGSSLWLQKAV